MQINTQHLPSSTGAIGVIMLDTCFPRFNGDIGNPHTWPFEVKFKVVTGASARKVVGATAEQELQPFIDAALELQQHGVNGITTSCGFLCLAQATIAQHLSVPFLASSLIQIPWVQAMLPANKQIGILTIDANALTRQHLLAAGAVDAIPVKGIPVDCHFYQAIMTNKPFMDRTVCEQENVDAARQFLEEYSNLGALILECTNMAPYASAINKATGLPVYSIYTLLRWFYSGLAPKSFTCPSNSV